MTTDPTRAAEIVSGLREWTAAAKIVVDIQIEAAMTGFRPMADPPFWSALTSIKLGGHMRRAGAHFASINGAKTDD